MPFNIEDLKSTLSKRHGLMRNNRFRVSFTLPNIFLDNVEIEEEEDRGLWRDAEIYCYGVNFPGFQLITHDVKRWTYGMTEKRPFAPNVGPLNLKFYSDNRGRYWRLFNTWLSLIMNHDISRSVISPSPLGESVNGYPYELSYKQEYVSDVTIDVFDERGEVINKIKCLEAFPSQVMDLDYDWGNTNDFARINVVMPFLDWHVVQEGAAA